MWERECPAQLLSIRCLELVLYIYYCTFSVGWGREDGTMGGFLGFLHFLNVLHNCIYLFLFFRVLCYVLYRPKNHVILTQVTF